MKLHDGSSIYQIVIVTDLDQNSKKENNLWLSFMKHGTLTINSDWTKASIQWHDGDEVILKSSLSVGDRSMELSDLVVYLSDGSGNESKPFKGEWLTVKDSELWAGGLGKEWTTSEGIFVSFNPMWVKKINPNGCVQHINWVEPYQKLRSSVGIEYPGYMIHESAQWSDIHQKWFFLPRRVSQFIYNEMEDEERGSNYLLVASQDFSQVDYRQIGNFTGSRGFSAFQFVPETNDRLIIALKSEEKGGKPVASYVTLFNIESDNILLNEEKLEGSYKYEGIAFV
ncbi:unnamed protein product [Dracunculus medinensis]|uniref:Apyrase n=1 Tax=Dracunculus medinensis TaxID=318479 RepID=A0A0N4UBW9_DRAME|nr:unnamed protein product [Dracunculus medinensis]